MHPWSALLMRMPRLPAFSRSLSRNRPKDATRKPIPLPSPRLLPSTIPELDRIKEAPITFTVLEGESLPVLSLRIFNGHLLMFLGFAVTIHSDSDRSLFVINDQIDCGRLTDRNLLFQGFYRGVGPAGFEGVQGDPG